MKRKIGRDKHNFWVKKIVNVDDKICRKKQEMKDQHKHQSIINHQRLAVPRFFPQHFYYNPPASEASRGVY